MCKTARLFSAVDSQFGTLLIKDVRHVEKTTIGESQSFLSVWVGSFLLDYFLPMNLVGDWARYYGIFLS